VSQQWDRTDEFFPRTVMPAQAGPRRQDAEPTIGEAGGPDCRPQERPAIQFDLRNSNTDPGFRRDDEQNTIHRVKPS